jgi:mRNA-degrading endonuclease RelE of RelBE toxin-antitoxin system
MNKTYSIYWSQTALDELSRILAYPPDVKERIYLESFTRLLFTPTLTAKQIKTGKLKGLWARLGLYQVILVFEVDENDAIVWINGIKHKRENVYWKRKRT